MIIDKEMLGECLEEEIKIEIFKEVRLVVPFYGSFDEDSVCHTVEQTKESKMMHRTIQRACCHHAYENIKIVVVGEINPDSIWQRSKPNRHINSMKIWWKSLRYGIKEYPAFVMICNKKIMVKEGVPTDEEVANMIDVIISRSKTEVKEDLT